LSAEMLEIKINHAKTVFCNGHLQLNIMLTNIIRDQAIFCLMNFQTILLL
jgi:hypothetical protein